MSIRIRRNPILESMKVDVPPGSRGGVVIDHLTITEEQADFANLRASINAMTIGGHGRGFVVPGTYTTLTIDGELVMSDTPDECKDHVPFIRQARGHVLIHGLGLGLAVKAVLAKEEVAHVTVVEINPDVIALVAPHYACDRLTVLQGDALTYKWDHLMHWDVVWHDIWPTISEDNLDDMKRLHRRFGRRCGWQGSWCREEAEWLASW